MNAPDASRGPVIRVSELARGETRSVSIVPGAESLAAIGSELELIELRKLRLDGEILPLGKRDWRFAGHLGATVVQPCVVTLAPVTTRIEEDVSRTWVADWAEPVADEVELPNDVDAEPLGTEIDLGTVLVEALALALPAYPRADDAGTGPNVFAEPGVKPMTDDDARPFAGLAALRDKLDGEGDN